MKFRVVYNTKKSYSLVVEAESKDEACEIADSAWCDYDAHDWKEGNETVDHVSVTQCNVSPIKQQ